MSTWKTKLFGDHAMHTGRRTCLAIAVLALFVGCQARVTRESFVRVGRPGCKTEAEVQKTFGPGVEVKDSYTESIIAAHKLPVAARFVRYQDAAVPVVLHHAVYVDGRVVESDSWVTGNTTAERDRWIETARKDYEKGHAVRSATPTATPK